MSEASVSRLLQLRVGRTVYECTSRTPESVGFILRDAVRRLLTIGNKPIVSNESIEIFDCRIITTDDVQEYFSRKPSRKVWNDRRIPYVRAAADSQLRFKVSLHDAADFRDRIRFHLRLHWFTKTMRRIPSFSVFSKTERLESWPGRRIWLLLRSAHLVAWYTAANELILLLNVVSHSVPAG